MSFLIKCTAESGQKSQSICGNMIKMQKLFAKCALGNIEIENKNVKKHWHCI